MDVDYTYSMTKRPTAPPPPPKAPAAPRHFFRQWRKYRSMTLEAAAELANMTAGNLSAMERGVQGYTTEGLEGLARAYKTSPGWLLEVNPLEEGGEGPIALYSRAKPTEKQMIADIVKTIVGKGQ